MLYRVLAAVLGTIVTAAPAMKYDAPHANDPDILTCDALNFDSGGASGTVDFSVMNPYDADLDFDTFCNYWDDVSDCEPVDADVFIDAYDYGYTSTTWTLTSSAGSGKIEFYVGSFKIIIEIPSGHAYTNVKDLGYCPTAI
jgi:hypothetical protein